LERGTRPDTSPEKLGRRWALKQFAGEIAVTERTIRNWLAGASLPSDISAIERALFGHNPSYDAWRNDLRNLYMLARSDVTKIDLNNGARNGARIDVFQSYLVETPLRAGGTMMSLSVSIGNKSNQLRPLSDMLAVSDMQGVVFSRAGDFNELLDFLLEGLPEYYVDEQKEDISNAIECRSAILYMGSIKAVQLSQLAKLPEIIKAFSNLSGTEFRVGLFRLSTTIIVITFASGGAAFVGWEAAKKLRDVATICLNELIGSESEASGDTKKVDNQNHPKGSPREKRT
jgi:hypothetical protein